MRRKKIGNKHKLPVAEVNIVSLMDILTTLLFFILMVMSFSKFSMLTGASMVSGTSSEKQEKVFALKIGLKSETEATLNLGAIDELKVVRKHELEKYLQKHFKGNSHSGYNGSIKATNLAILLKQINKHLSAIKMAFPHEHKIVLGVSDSIQYQQVILVMDGLKSLAPGQDGFIVETLIGTKEKTTVLFPQIILAEI